MLSVATCSAQTAFNILFPVTGVVQAPDGNYYVSTGSIIYQITGTGSVNSFYKFLGKADGGDASALTVGADGRLYGTTTYGGANGFGTIFAIDLKGTFTTLYSFPQTACSNDIGFYWLIQASDGNLYGPYQDTIFKISTTGQYSVASTLANSALACNSQVMQASDGNFYGSAASTIGNSATFIYKVTPAGVQSTLYTFPSDDEWVTPLGEGKNGDLFGGSDDGYFLITTAGAYSLLNSTTELSTAPILGSSGMYASGPFRVSQGNNSGVYQLQPDGTSNEFFSFFFEGPSYPLGGSASTYPLIQGSDGNIYGTSTMLIANDDSYPGTVYKLPPAGAPLLAPVQVSVTPSRVSIGQKATLKWSVPQAINSSYPICFASGNGGWSGLQHTSGSVTETIDTAGTYSFALTCGGNESGVATVVVSQDLPSAVTLAATPNPVLAGKAVKLTASTGAQNGSGPKATGNVSFYYLTDLLGTATIADGIATFTASSAGIPVGSYAITAKYSGDENYAPATSSPLTVKVASGYATTSILAVSPNPVTQGSAATLAASVGDANKDSITGTVIFTADGVVIGSGTLSHNSTTGANTATLTASTQSVAPATYTVKAQYQGSGLYLGSTSAGVQVQVQASK